MAKRLVFLQLAPEFGSTKFGPFPNPEIRLGSDPGRNDIVLPEALGISPEHARLVKQVDESFILAPVERTAQVYVWRADGRAAKQITAPVAVVAGDGFSLVTQDGPRFVIVLEYPKQAAAAEAGKVDPLLGKAKGRLSQQSLMKEIKRQGLTRALTTAGAQNAMKAWTFIKSGAIFQPRYIITGLFLATGWIAAGATTCAGAGIAWQGQKTQGELDECKGDLAAYEGKGDDGDISLGDVVVQMLGDDDWGRTLTEDANLRTKFKERLKVIQANKDKYAWVHKRSDSAFAQFRRRLDSQGMPPALVRVLAYMAAVEGFNRDREWELVIDSDSEEACGRGPLLLTWRQGKHLEFDPLQLDAPVDAHVAGQGSISELVAALEATANDPSVEIDEAEIDRETGTVAGGKQCVYVNGEDYRNDMGKLVVQIDRAVGMRGKGLPDEGDSYWLPMRLLKIYAADFERGFDEVKYDNGSMTPSVVLDSVSSLTDARKDYAIEGLADTMAKATMIPCLAMLDKQTQSPAEEVTKDFPKSKVTCGLLFFMVEEDAM